ncbi:MAG: hypothetical protein JEZ08_16805 [Clostridiales bacterium]|nr:hypothetical protein [Clostridiales bacterium]
MKNAMHTNSLIDISVHEQLNLMKKQVWMMLCCFGFGIRIIFFDFIGKEDYKLISKLLNKLFPDG